MSAKEKNILGTSLKSLLEDKESYEDLESLEAGLDSVEPASNLEEDREIITESEVTGSEAAEEETLEAPKETFEAPKETLDAQKDTGGDGETETEQVQPQAVVIDDVEIFQSFLQESQDHLENMEHKILKLEADNDPAIVNDIFRSMHTMKGTSSFFGLVKIKEISHSLESVLDDLRADKIGISGDLVDVLLGGTDLLTKIVGYLNRVAGEHQGTTGRLEIPDSGIDISPILSRIQGLGSKTETDALSKEKSKEDSVQELITDEMVEKFIAESQDLLDNTERDILELEKRPDDKGPLDDAFRSIHTIKGNAGFLGYGNFETMCMDTESVLDSIRNGEKKASPQVVTILLNTIDSMRKVLDTLKGSEREGAEGSSAEDGEEQEEYRPVGEILVEMGETTPEVVESALDLQEKRVGEILVAEGKVSEQALKKALESQGKVAVPDQPGAHSHAVERKDIRVDMGKLDKLFDLMGELITAEAMVIHNPELEGLELESFDRAGNYLAKITREMQEITMTVRMIPLEGLFNKMRRLVRDLSRKFGKKIHLAVSGQETEMDRNVIEEISDPLVHILRNAIDHGIEDKSSRVKNGKEETGTVNLSAKYEGNEIWIMIKDDGAGLNREKILDKAEERGLVKVERESMSDEEVWELVFEPGFSTAEKVSEISGRGVGMDVVNRNIEKLRGKIDIKSTAGQGTEIILRIPLTLAIIDGITANVGGTLYALPLGDILEFHKGSEEQITRTDSKGEVLRLREEIIPVIKLYEFFNVGSMKKGIGDGILIVVQSNGKKAALLVDDITGYQQVVVKALPEYMGNMRGISGCSIMGDGEVSLIIDVGSLLKEELE